MENYISVTVKNANFHPEFYLMTKLCIDLLQHTIVRSLKITPRSLSNKTSVSHARATITLVLVDRPRCHLLTAKDVQK
jgi:hypothetical protein